MNRHNIVKEVVGPLTPLKVPPNFKRQRCMYRSLCKAGKHCAFRHDDDHFASISMTNGITLVIATINGKKHIVIDYEWYEYDEKLVAESMQNKVPSRVTTPDLEVDQLTDGEDAPAAFSPGLLSNHASSSVASRLNTQASETVAVKPVDQPTRQYNAEVVRRAYVAQEPRPFPQVTPLHTMQKTVLQPHTMTATPLVQPTWNTDSVTEVKRVGQAPLSDGDKWSLHWYNSPFGPNPPRDPPSFHTPMIASAMTMMAPPTQSFRSTVPSPFPVPQIPALPSMQQKPPRVRLTPSKATHHAKPVLFPLLRRLFHATFEHDSSGMTPLTISDYMAYYGLFDLSNPLINYRYRIESTTLPDGKRMQCDLFSGASSDGGTHKLSTWSEGDVSGYYIANVSETAEPMVLQSLIATTKVVLGEYVIVRFRALPRMHRRQVSIRCSDGMMMTLSDMELKYLGVWAVDVDKFPEARRGTWQDILNSARNFDLRFGCAHYDLLSRLFAIASEDERARALVPLLDKAHLDIYMSITKETARGIYGWVKAANERCVVNVLHQTNFMTKCEMFPLDVEY